MHEHWTLRIVDEIQLGEWMEDNYETRKVFGLTAHNEDGRRFAYCGPIALDDKLSALELRGRIKLYRRFNPWTPVGNRHWVEIHPVYGSAEYQLQGTEGDWAAQERAMDPWFGEDAVRMSYMG